MTFDSIEFVIFFAVIYASWFVVRNAERPYRNAFLLLASYFFYGFWSPPFVILIVISTLVDFYLGRAIEQSNVERTRKLLVAGSVAINLSILGFFKYFNFFVDSAIAVLPEGSFTAPGLEVILPVGISFYTFQSMSYSIDIYRKQIKASDSLLDFAVYVAFFPQLVAGPIERAGNMLKQFTGKPQQTVDRTLDGFDLILRGFFKKIVVADNIAPFVNMVFGDVDSASTLSMWMACYAFGIQLYCDFSGYTDIARGTSKLLGFELMENFKAPFGARNISDFWKRWHISLSTWLRDYLYISLGGNRGTKLLQLRNLVIVMALGGLWHGAAWHFLLWGVYHGALLVLYHSCKPLLDAITAGFNKPMQKAFGVLSWLVTFQLVTISWAFFRAETTADLQTALSIMLINPLQNLLTQGIHFVPNAGLGEELFYLALIAGAMLFQITYKESGYSWSRAFWVRGGRGAVSLAMMLFLYPSVKEQFIYFQF